MAKNERHQEYFVCVCVCVCARVRVSVSERERESVCVREREIADIMSLPCQGTELLVLVHVQTASIIMQYLLS